MCSERDTRVPSQPAVRDAFSQKGAVANDPILQLPPEAVAQTATGRNHRPAQPGPRMVVKGRISAKEAELRVEPQGTRVRYSFF